MAHTKTHTFKHTRTEGRNEGKERHGTTESGEIGVAMISCQSDVEITSSEESHSYTCRVFCSTEDQLSHQPRLCVLIYLPSLQ